MKLRNAADQTANGGRNVVKDETGNACCRRCCRWLGEICQVCEFSTQCPISLIVLSALSPTPPFPKDAHRLRLAGVLMPCVAIALLTTSSIFMKMSTLFFGIGFFGDPITLRAVKLLNEKIPNWQKYVELRQ